MQHCDAASQPSLFVRQSKDPAKMTYSRMDLNKRGLLTAAVSAELQSEGQGHGTVHVAAASRQLRSQAFCVLICVSWTDRAATTQVNESKKSFSGRSTSLQIYHAHATAKQAMMKASHEQQWGADARPSKA